jgi:GNAT superfamily N-acetyltransferase
VALTIRVADLGADRELLIDTLRRHLTPLSDAARFEWLYRASPYGPAVAWIAVDDGRGETVGVASAFPRRAVRDGKDERCWVLGDFCIHAQYRTLGPALALNRACLAGVDQGTVAFCYDFPSDRMMAVYRRLGIQPFGKMIRFAKVLRWGQKLRDAVPVPGIRTGLGILGDIADLRPAHRPTPPQGTTVALEDKDCDEAFDDLDRANRERFRLYLARSAAYLNWRYRANPLGRYEILAARRGGELLGYAAFTQTGPDALLADLFAREDRTTKLLLDELTALLRARDAVTLSVPALSSHPLIPHLLRSGFRPRETSPVILHRRPEPGATEDLDCGDWPLLYGDRDS